MNTGQKKEGLPEEWANIRPHVSWIVHMAPDWPGKSSGTVPSYSSKGWGWGPLTVRALSFLSEPKMVIRLGLLHHCVYSTHLQDKHRNKPIPGTSAGYPWSVLLLFCLNFHSLESLSAVKQTKQGLGWTSL